MISMDNKRTSQVFIVDDHPMLRMGLTKRINHSEGLQICGEADNVQDAISAVVDLEPDLVIVDISLKGQSGLTLVKNLKARDPHLPILVFSVHDESVYAERVLRAGALGYIMKHVTPDLLVAAVRRVLRGEIYLSDPMTKKILHRFAKKTGNSSSQLLTDRELEIFELLGQGMEPRQIAEKLNLSQRTVATHQARIKGKFHIRTTVELVRQAAQWVHIENQN